MFQWFFWSFYENKTKPQNLFSFLRPRVSLETKAWVFFLQNYTPKLLWGIINLLQFLCSAKATRKKLYDVFGLLNQQGPSWSLCLDWAFSWWSSFKTWPSHSLTQLSYNNIFIPAFCPGAGLQPFSSSVSNKKQLFSVTFRWLLHRSGVRMGLCPGTLHGSVHIVSFPATIPWFTIHWSPGNHLGNA